MGAWCDAMVDASTGFFRWAFPEEIEIPDCLRQLYERLYPDVDWDSVSFHLGKPWFAKFGSIRGITLPDYYGVHEIKIYFSTDAGVYDPCSCAGQRTPVHEGYHVQQYRELADGAGLGFVRGFMIAYLAGSWRGGGSSHSMEAAAHDYHDRFLACCVDPACDCSTDPPTFDSAAVDALVACDPSLVVTDTGVSFWQLMLDAAPGADWLWGKGRELGQWACQFDRDNIEIETDPPTNVGLSERSWHAVGRWMLVCSSLGFVSLLIRLFAGIWALIWGIIATIVTIILAILLPIIDLILLIIDGILWIITGIVCAIEWLIDKIRAGLIAVCDWATRLERRCDEWREDRERTCAEEEDQGYDRCSREEDQGHNECCGWWPCSWACDAWVWVSNIVCVAWTWVSNFVCVAWTWIVSRACVAFTWVVTTSTCWAR